MERKGKLGFPLKKCDNTGSLTGSNQTLLDIVGNQQNGSVLLVLLPKKNVCQGFRLHANETLFRKKNVGLLQGGPLLVAK